MLIMDPFNHFTACMPDFSGTKENTARLSAGIIRHICAAYSAPPGVQYIAVRGVSNHITSFVLLQHDNCYYSGRGLPWATVYKRFCQIMARSAAVACAETPSGNIRVGISFTTGAVRSAILATAGLLVNFDVRAIWRSGLSARSP